MTLTYMILRVVRDWLVVEETKAQNEEYREAIRESKEAVVKLMKFL